MTRPAWIAACVLQTLGLGALPWALRGGPNAAAIVVAIVGVILALLTRRGCSGQECAR